MSWSRQFSLRERILLLIFALLLLFSVYYFAVMRPVNDAIYNAQVQCENLSTEIDILTARATRLDSMKAELEIIKSSGNSAAVPDYDNLQQLMGFLNSVFSGSSYELTIQGVQQPTDGSKIVRRTMQMTFVSPSYDAAKAAVVQLQSSPYCCQIGSVSMTTDSNTNATSSLLGGAVRTTLTITFYESIA